MKRNALGSLIFGLILSSFAYAGDPAKPFDFKGSWRGQLNALVLSTEKGTQLVDPSKISEYGFDSAAQQTLEDLHSQMAISVTQNENETSFHQYTWGKALRDWWILAHAEAFRDGQMKLSDYDFDHPWTFWPTDLDSYRRFLQQSDYSTKEVSVFDTHLNRWGLELETNTPLPNGMMKVETVFLDEDRDDKTISLLSTSFACPLDHAGHRLDDQCTEYGVKNKDGTLFCYGRRYLLFRE